ncbi:MAG: EAL domain-containing protein [Pseudonocardiales bacterium]|nr:EAL domain-containing protein [Pseudonocardiales bacterium]MBV9028791.1 EAL domain-containing protein [Pseudonocardiales bacterium]
MGQNHTEKPGAQAHSLASAALAQEWVRALATSSCLPMSLAQTRDHLRDLTERLVAALSGPSVDTQAASTVGARLVEGGFTGAQTLSRTFEVLGAGLPAVAGPRTAGPLCGRIIELLGALAAGYTWALRNRVVDQQEEVKRALSQAWQALERDLRASQARFREVFDLSPVGIAISEPNGRIVQANQALEDTLGYSPGELLRHTLSELFAPGVQSITPERRRRVRFPLRRADGETAWVYLASSALLDAEQAPRHILTTVEDITDLCLLERRLHHQTLHDPQTGLPNRRYLRTHLEKVLARSAPSAVVTLMHLDLDGFSAINDGLGHDTGDRLLSVVARRLEGVVVDQRAMVARLGDDEYAILVEPEAPVPDVGAFAEAINTELAEPCYIDGVGVAVTASIGAAQRRVAGTKAEELMRAASATLLRMRGRSTRQWELFHPDIDAVHVEELRLAAAMPGALETGELAVTYQPVVMLDGGRLVGIEAALSWRHPQLGMLSGEQCMRAAERTGVVHEAGQWLLRTAAEQAVSWRRRTGGGVPPVVVNLSLSQARDRDLVARVRAVLDETGLRPAGLELRAPVAAIRTVTGEPAGAGGGQAEDNLRKLAALGVRAGLYDFGGGIGGLRCLVDLPVRTVRIAQPVSEQVAADPSRILSQAAQALVHIVRGAGVDVVAFPVDSAEQAACWPWIGANWALGALFGEPGPPAGIEARLRRR